MIEIVSSLCDYERIPHILYHIGWIFMNRASQHLQQCPIHTLSALEMKRV